MASEENLSGCLTLSNDRIGNFMWEVSDYAKKILAELSPEDREKFVKGSLDSIHAFLMILVWMLANPQITSTACPEFLEVIRDFLQKQQDKIDKK
ncbi:hypothetical protein A3C78_01555 [Candidatus Azambacteria bacterium RIFCSPHIGHO2_02_FULL_45_18]|uniref:Uncharacterized protein n=1 Tax=Candidatus Azambacteria bacterium RIFCSPLOWO2_02_FULL_44_14 TaxID=1797306 RepID=A0A1F5CBD8_9BACT|nr:MAG: hypothetical protein A3C78_01555 [Candidatus Azambacteria bacterium RIFCSPHIGHO2_02_FULL_45_18]OGD40138.1 MAG: hypothetical protein A3I30_02610 [Candidatus Azambacteria bacterium RIFCSPLOWO2_02_FULL_44_14]